MGAGRASYVCMYVSPSSLIHPPPLHSCSYLPVQVNVTVYFSVTVDMMTIEEERRGKRRGGEGRGRRGERCEVRGEGKERGLKGGGREEKRKGVR